MKRHLTIRMITAALFGVVFGTYTHFEHLKWVQDGRQVRSMQPRLLGRGWSGPVSAKGIFRHYRIVSGLPTIRASKHLLALILW